MGNKLIKKFRIKQNTLFLFIKEHLNHGGLQKEFINVVCVQDVCFETLKVLFFKNVLNVK